MCGPQAARLVVSIRFGSSGRSAVSRCPRFRNGGESVDPGLSRGHGHRGDRPAVPVVPARQPAGRGLHPAHRGGRRLAGRRGAAVQPRRRDPGGPVDRGLRQECARPTGTHARRTHPCAVGFRSARPPGSPVWMWIPISSAKARPIRYPAGSAAGAARCPSNWAPWSTVSPRRASGIDVLLASNEGRTPPIRA